MERWVGAGGGVGRGICCDSSFPEVLTESFKKLFTLNIALHCLHLSSLGGLTQG